MADKWLGGKPVCDFCKNTTFPYFVDGKTNLGPWALMCPSCFKTRGTGLGLGRGQRYNGTPPYEKTAG